MTKVILHQFPNPETLPNFSPFCMKLETYLRMAKVEYQVKAAMNPGKGPKGKMPFIELDEKCYYDSALIINFLQQQDECNLDAFLTDQQKAQATALQRLCEDHLYWGIVYSRWQDENGWMHWRDALFSSVPKFLFFLPNLIRKKALKELHGQGFGRLAADEIYQVCSQDLWAMEQLFTRAPFFFGDQATTLDACLYSFVGSILFTPWDFPLKQSLLLCPKLLAFYKRMTEAYFPEFPASVTS